MFKIFGVNFLKIRNFGMARLYLKVTICKPANTNKNDIFSITIMYPYTIMD